MSITTPTCNFKAIEIPYSRRDFDLVTLWQLFLILTVSHWVRRVHQLIASEVKPPRSIQIVSLHKIEDDHQWQSY